MIKKRPCHSKIVFKTAVYFLLNHDKHLVIYFLWFCPNGTTTALISEPQLIGRSEGLYAISSAETVLTKDFQRLLATGLQRSYTTRWTDLIVVGPPGGELFSE